MSSDLTTYILLEKFKQRLAKVEAKNATDGKDGAQGPKGDKGADGKQGPKGPVGPTGPKGSEGPKGPEGKEGADGESGIGIVDAYTSADGDLVFVMSDDSELSVQMPLSTDENGGTIVYSQGGGSGGDGGGSIGTVTTSMVQTEPLEGEVKSIILPELNNQLEVNRWFLEQIDKLEDGRFVKKEGGDSMEGPLSISMQPGTSSRDSRRVNTLGVYSNSDSSALRLGTTRDRVYIGHNDTSFNGPIKVDEIQEKNVGDGIQLTDRVILKTEGVEDDEAVTKKYIDDMARHLQDEIVELEEEIDAIAPSVERGRWSFTAVGTVAQPGQFTMYDADFGNGSPTGLFKNAKSIWFNELDLDGTPHSFANVKDGELLEIFIDGSPDYGLFSVTGEAHDETQSGAKFWVIDVDFVRTNEATTAIGPGEICRFKIFEAPSGGDATSFVMKSGDTMTGNLVINKGSESNDVESRLTITGSRPSTTDAAATIKFLNNQDSSSGGFLSYRSSGASSWFGFNRDVDLSNKGLHSVGRIRMEPNGGIGSGNNTRLSFHNASTGQEGEGLLVVPRPSNDRRGFAIRGNNADGDELDLLYTYTNPKGTPDAANYVGKIDSPKNLVNKAYVDSKFQDQPSSSSQSPVMLTSGYDNQYSYKNTGSVSSEQFSSESLEASGNTIYLYRAYNKNGGSTMVVYHEATEDSEIEIWEHKAVGEPMLIIRAGIRQISTSLYSNSDAKLLLNRFWSKPDYKFSTTKKYTFMIRGLVQSPSRSQDDDADAPTDLPTDNGV